jgi:hypothetical protein
MDRRERVALADFSGAVRIPGLFRFVELIRGLTAKDVGAAILFEENIVTSGIRE